MILLTACINPSNVPFLAVKNSEIRLKQYLEALHYYICDTKVEDIVFIDNSNFDYDYSVFLKLAKEKNKNIEIRRFSGNVKNVTKKGKGYGEGEIIKYAYQHSKIIKTAKSFIKITGRIKVKNIDKIISKINENGSYFNMNKRSNKLTTVMFQLNIETYKEYFIDAHNLVDDINGVYFETIYYETILKNKITTKNFPIFPSLEGVSGSTGNVYKIKYKLVRNILSAINYFGVNLNRMP